MFNIINQSGGQVTIINPPYHSQPRLTRAGAGTRAHTHAHTVFTILPRENLVSVRVRRVGNTAV